MKTIFDILNTTYDTTIIKKKEIKKEWKKMMAKLEKNSIPLPGKTDTSFFQTEIILNSLEIKEKFEEVFLDTYVRMHDYWYDLTYQERKSQMNVEIHKLIESLSFFSADSQEIYMPCFDAKFNHLYTDEIVLLDLKQYHTFIRSFASQVHLDEYGVLPFVHGFSSACVLQQKEQDFVLYHSCVNRLYLYKNNIFVKALSLHPDKKPERKDILESLAHEMLLDHEDGLIEILIENPLLSKHLTKKIIKLKYKKMKRIHKEEKKEKKRKKKE